MLAINIQKTFGNSQKANVMNNIDSRQLKFDIENIRSTTALLCRHISSGVNDLQHEVISILDWTESIRKHINLLISKLNVDVNSCPRVKIGTSKCKR
jgi:hypothetical protein